MRISDWSSDVFSSDLSRRKSSADGILYLSSWSRSPYPLWGGLSWGRTARQYVSFCNLSRSNAICELSGIDGTEQRDRVQRLRPSHPMVCARLSRRHFHRLLVSAQTDRAARRADGAAPCRRHDLLRDARDHPRRAAWLCALLQSRQLSRKAARNLQIVGWRHVAARRGDRRAGRNLVCDEEGKAQLPALLRLYRLRRPLRPLLRAPRQFRERDRKSTRLNSRH